MRKILLSVVFGTAALLNFAQPADSINQYKNVASSLMEKDAKITIGGYGQIDYNQPLSSGEYKNGTLDVHRMVLLFGYKFSDRAQFITEIEYEHVSEVYVEQAFLDYKINRFVSFRGGLLLIPMGIINEFHEPPTFNGVERPLIDKYIAPSTWREVGFGFTGNITGAQIRYQAYVVNGFSGYADGTGKLSGKNGLRKGRQKGIVSFMSSPNFTTKVEYYGFRGLNVGVSGYFGKTQSTRFDGLSKNDDAAKASADSSVVGVAMVGLDARYNYKGVQLKGQLYLNSLSNTKEYNELTGNDLGNAMVGYYVEAGYNVFRTFKNTKSQLIPFVRYEHYNTQQGVEAGIAANNAYNVNAVTTGLGWRITPKAALKADMQFVKSAADTQAKKIFSAGVGIMF